MTVFYLVRHAEHGHVGQVLTGRLAGVPLVETGRRQARILGANMAAVRPAVVYTSPRRRARETASQIAAAADCPLDVAQALDEIDFGHWTGRTFKALESDPDWKRWNAERDTATTPAGESMATVATRFCRFVERLREGDPDGSACLVSHADVIKAGLCRMLGRPFAAVHDFEISPASVTTLRVDGTGASLLSLDARGPVRIGEPAQ